MQTLKSLIDKASRLCGSDAKLSRRMHISKAYLSQMRHGVRAITPEMAAKLAEITGDDARAFAITALIKQSPKRRLRNVLAKKRL